MFLNLLQEITLEELEVLRGFAQAVPELRKERAEGATVDMQAIDYSQEAIGGFPTTTYREMIQSLIRKGLLFDDSHGRFGTKPFVIVEGTDLAAHFYEWLTE